jgi:hypothetical protein
VEQTLTAWQPGLPRIDHLVTLSTPHKGTHLARLGPLLAEGTLTGGLLARAVADWSERGGPIPDPFADSLIDMSPGSPLLGALAAEDVLFGTRVLSLATVGDVVVPPTRAHWDGEMNRIVRLGGPSSHTGILRSADALRIAGSFLRDAPDPCLRASDYLGSAAGSAVDAAHRLVPELYSGAEEWLLRRIMPGGRRLERGTRR